MFWGLDSFTILYFPPLVAQLELYEPLHQDGWNHISLQGAHRKPTAPAPAMLEVITFLPGVPVQRGPYVRVHRVVPEWEQPLAVPKRSVTFRFSQPLLLLAWLGVPCFISTERNGLHSDSKVLVCSQLVV